MENMKNPVKQAVTIRDIARRAGVSIATVSRVLNGSLGVLPATQSAVLEVVRLTAYKRNPYAVKLAKDRRGKQPIEGGCIVTHRGRVRKPWC